VVVLVSASVSPAVFLRPYALFCHVVFLAVSFGAVLAVALNGLALALRRVSVGHVLGLSLALDPLIWLGLVGMCASGILLDPRLGRPLTIVKLLLVLAVALDGILARDLMRELRRLPADVTRVPARLLARATFLAFISQLGWWGAVVIGFLTTNARR
jgi:hypothetical protein